MRVLIVDDHKLFAEAIRTFLEADGMEVLLAASGHEGIVLANLTAPDVVIIDVGLPDADGIEVGRRILKDRPEAKVLALSPLKNPRVLEEAIRASFRGCLTKDSSVLHFLDSIRAVVNGQMVRPWQAATPIPGSRSPEERDATLLAEHLTPREREVLGLLVEGATSEQIIRMLSVSPNTVRTHIQSILTKLQVHSRLEAATFAVRYGIVKVPRMQLAR